MIFGFSLIMISCANQIIGFHLCHSCYHKTHAFTSVFRHSFLVKCKHTIFYYRKGVGCLPKLAVGFGKLRLPKWGFRPKPQARKKDVSVFFILVFRDRFANEKAPPVISSRPFHGEHFMQTTFVENKRSTLDRIKK